MVSTGGRPHRRPSRGEPLTKPYARAKRTIATLIRKPGALTRAAIAGNTAPYLSPARLYLLMAAVALAITYLFHHNASTIAAREDDREFAYYVDVSTITHAPYNVDPRPGQIAREATIDTMRQYAFAARPSLRAADYAIGHFKNDTLRRITAIALLFSVPLLAMLFMIIAYGHGERKPVHYLIHSAHFHAWLFFPAIAWWFTLYLPLAWQQLAAFTLLAGAATYLFVSVQRVYERGTLKSALFIVAAGGAYYLVGNTFAEPVRAQLAAADAAAYEFGISLWNEARVMQAESLRDSAAAAERQNSPDRQALAKRALTAHEWMMLRTDPDYDLHVARLQLQAGNADAAIATVRRYRRFFEENINGAALECRILIVRAETAAARDVCTRVIRYMDTVDKPSPRMLDPGFVRDVQQARTWLETMK